METANAAQRQQAVTFVIASACLVALGGITSWPATSTATATSTAAGRTKRRKPEVFLDYVEQPSIRNCTVAVTGSSSGIGRAIAIAFAKQGANILLHGRAPSDHLSAVEDEIRQFGCDVTSLYGDFSAAMNWTDFAQSAWAWKGRIDTWINNAGGDVLTGAAKKLSLSEKLDYLFQTDVKATLLLSKVVGELMIESASPSSNFTIINIGWDQAAQGMAGESGELFATTKGAIMAMSKSLAQSMAPQVRVNCIAPGWIQTQWGNQASELWQQRAVADSLMNRWGTPEDIADVAVFLASKSASFVSGNILPVNGGFRYFKDETEERS